jgi:hypothetical protein
MRRFAFLIPLLLLFTAAPALAQQIKIVEDPLIAQMMNQFIQNNKAQSTIEGWRIEILATPSRSQMESVMQSFQYRYPNIPIDWVHVNPLFKLRVGAFATKVEATHMLHVLKNDYPGAYRVVDNKMRPEELIY